MVIVHPSNRFEALSRSKVGYLFLRKVSRWPWGAEVAPVDLAADGPIRREFVQQALRMSEEQLAEYWIDQRATLAQALQVSTDYLLGLTENPRPRRRQAKADDGDKEEAA